PHGEPEGSARGARASRLRARRHPAADLRALRRRGERARHDRAAGARLSNGGWTMTDGKNLPTVCVLCSHNCGVLVDVENGRIVAVRGDDTNPITKGYVCNKAFSIQHYVEHGDRVRHPLRRTADGLFEQIDWETAIAEIATRLNDIR